MIAHLSGTVIRTRPGAIVLAVNGVGYLVHCTARLLETVAPGSNLDLHTHLAVREDAMELFGFVEHEELEFFRLLIGISGIGPRSALGIIGLESAQKLSSAIASGDIGYLTKVSGVGKKSAEKIVLELRDKVGGLAGEGGVAVRKEDEDVLEALMALGYRHEEARDALRQISQESSDPGMRIKEALRLLARG